MEVFSALHTFVYYAYIFKLNLNYNKLFLHVFGKVRAFPVNHGEKSMEACAVSKDLASSVIDMNEEKFSLLDMHYY